MFNQTDDVQSNKLKNQSQDSSLLKNTHVSPTISHQNINDSSNQNRLIKIYKKIGLQTKAIIFAIAISTLPILGVGFLANKLVTDSFTQKVSQNQAAATEFADKVKLFISERYRDIEILVSLPILNRSSWNDINGQTKQEILDKFIAVHQVYDSIAIFDLNGDRIVQSTGDTLANNQDRSYFQKVKETNLPYITPVMASQSSGKKSVYIVAPIKNPDTGETNAIIRARMPIKLIEPILKKYTLSGVEQNYHVVDSLGSILLSSKNQDIGKKITAKYKLLKNGQQKSNFVVDNQNHAAELVNYVPVPTLTDLPNSQWKVLTATNKNNTFASSRELLLTIAIATGLTVLIVVAIAAWLARRITQPILQATTAVTKIGQGDFNTRLHINRQDELGVLGHSINQMAEQLQLLLTEKKLDSTSEKSLADVTFLTRETLEKQDIFTTSVEQIRYALNADRTIIYQFNPENCHGKVIAESLAADCSSILGEEIDDPCLRERHEQSDQDGKVQVKAISDIYKELTMTNAQCYIEMLEKYAVKANLIAPIMNRGELVGLMIVHHCQAPHNWQQKEIDLFKQLVTQVGYALEQANVLEELEQAREKEQQQKEQLQLQILDLLNDVEGVASGDLRVRAEITSGEIGTVADFFNSIIESLRLIVTQVQETATQVNNSLETSETATRQLAESALTQTTEINHVLDAVDQMNDSMITLESSAQEAAAVANQAATTTQESGQAMELTVQNILSLRETMGDTGKKVKRLGESTQQITHVVSLINEIAMQTHLLAINAGIEAARAGEEGEGFAVVAEEVGILATRSGAATQEIAKIVENIQQETSDLVQAMELGVTQVVEGTQIVDSTKQSLYQIFAVSRQIDSLVQSVSAATTSQVQTAQTVSQLMREIASISQGSSESSRQVSASLQQTVEISQQLQATVGTFRVS
ncbi:methyl-accepting chemotaxis protein [Calothrix rhizosoleniae]|uniref:methyl-accepting chemotaxis protein n=1 Tax=Calothrix rhizosoleniae TaxID=888997 RepID=UPI000B4A20DE|nr:methyl-accepting chemotaxis protein [Calothrix rhizosoleniae]